MAQYFTQFAARLDLGSPDNLSSAFQLYERFIDDLFEKDDGGIGFTIEADGDPQHPHLGRRGPWAILSMPPNSPCTVRRPSASKAAGLHLVDHLFASVSPAASPAAATCST